MSVFTPVEPGELAAWLDACGAGAPLARHGLEGGVENSNYCVTTDRGRFVLTLFEWQPRAAAERTLALTDALADAGLPVARPWPQRAGWTAPLAGKPAALAAWIDGAHPDTPTPAQCAAVGAFLADLHRSDVGAGLRPATLPDTRGDAWLHATATKIRPSLSPDHRALLDAALAGATPPPDLPTGIIHADLFRDNALFEGDTLVGVIDFHYACRGPLLYDLAVAALDWCGDDAGRLHALCRAYASRRAPDAAERAAFPRLLQRAALRFWLSRAHDALHPRPGRAVLAKDPAQMAARLAALRAAPPAFAA